MKKTFIIIPVFFLSFIICPPSQAFNKRIAVLPFNVSASNDEYKSLSTGIPEMLMTDLGKSKRITFIERLQIEKALKELGLAMVGVVDEKTAVKVGEWLGCEDIIIGNVSVLLNNIRIDARVIDLKTGRLIESSKIEGKTSEIFRLTDQLASNLLYVLTNESMSFRDTSEEKILLDKFYTINVNNQINYVNNNNMIKSHNFRFWTDSEIFDNQFLKTIRFNFNNQYDFIPNLNASSIRKDCDNSIQDNNLICTVKIKEFRLRHVEYAKNNTTYLDDMLEWVKVKVTIKSVQ